MKVALIQMPCVPDPTQNRNRLAEHIATAAQGGAELVVLQELHNTPYFCQTENTYQALIYFKANGDRTDRLVGYTFGKWN